MTVAALLLALAACRPATGGGPPSETSGSGSPGTEPTGAAHTGAPTEPPCGVPWPAADPPRSSDRPCTGWDLSACFADEACVDDRCGLSCEWGDPPCPAGETCTEVDVTFSGSTYGYTYDTVEATWLACRGDDPPLPDGPLGGLGSFATIDGVGGSTAAAGADALYLARGGELSAVALAADGIPTGASVSRLGGPRGEALALAVAAGRLYVLADGAMWSAPVDGPALTGAWRGETVPDPEPTGAALVAAGGRLVLLGGELDGAPSPLLFSAPIEARGALARWEHAFVGPFTDGGAEATVLGDDLFLLDASGRLWSAPVSDLPAPTFAPVPVAPPRGVDRTVALLAVCDGLVQVGDRPRLTTHLLPLPVDGAGWEPEWRIGSATELLDPSGGAALGGRIYVVGRDALATAAREP